jgi:prefoldin subunit 1
MSSISTDDQLKAHFLESQSKLQEISRTLSTVKSQLQSNARDTRVAQLCNKELGALDGNTVTYRAIGRMYFVF